MAVMLWKRGRRLLAGSTKRGLVTDDTFGTGDTMLPEDGEILQENIGAVTVSPEQAENLKRVFNTTNISEVYLS